MAWSTLFVSLLILVPLCSGFLEVDEGYKKKLEFCGYEGECNTTVIISPKFVEFHTCYKIAFDRLSWADAKKKCAERGGRLAEIDDEATLEFIQSSGRNMRKVQDITAWLGAKENGGGVFSWDSTSSSQKLKVDNFSPVFELKERRYHCMFTSFYTGYWFDFECTYKNYFICERNDKLDEETRKTDKNLPPCEKWFD